MGAAVDDDVDCDVDINVDDDVDDMAYLERGLNESKYRDASTMYTMITIFRACKSACIRVCARARARVRALLCTSVSFFVVSASRNVCRRLRIFTKARS